MAHVYGKQAAPATPRVILEFRVDVEPPEARPWKTFAAMAFNPRIPTLAEAMAEAARFAAHLRPLVERGEGAYPMALAYLWATRR